MIAVEKVQNGFLLETDDGAKHIARTVTEATEIFRDEMNRRFNAPEKVQQPDTPIISHPVAACCHCGIVHPGSSACYPPASFLRRQAI
jgi:hypothetical protein